MFKLKNLIIEFLFISLFVYIAPFHYRPKRCPLLYRDECGMWNCAYHFKDGKYDKCQRK